MKREPELGVVWPQAKEHQGLLGTERNKEEPLREGSANTFILGLLASRTMRG